MVLPIPSTYSYQQGIKLYHQGQTEQAKALLTQAVVTHPEDTKILSGLGVICKQLGDYKQAEAYYLKALSLDEKSVDVWCNLGNLYLTLKRFDAAEQALKKGLKIDKNHALSLNNLGSCAIQQGDYERALPLYEAAYHFDSKSGNIAFNLSWALLRIGEFRQGFKLYESRFTKTGDRARLNGFSTPRWRGTLQSDQKLALVCEQGFGDTLQFFRFIEEAFKRFNWRIDQILIGVQPELLTLLKMVKPNWQWFDINLPPNHLDYHCPIMSLPMVLGVTPFCLRQSPYIAVPSVSSERFKHLFSTSQVKIGLCWQGSPTHSNDANRSIAIEELCDSVFKHQSGFQLYAVQKGMASETLPLNMTALDAHMKDFKHTASLISHLDLIVTVDTSVAHLAAAMGKCVYVLIAKQHDWRWFAERSDSPWYQNVRLFRQQTLQDWSPVYKELKAVLNLESFIF